MTHECSDGSIGRLRVEVSSLTRGCYACHAVDLPRAAANDVEREHRRASQLVRLLLWNVLQSAAQPNTAAAIVKSAWTRSLKRSPDRKLPDPTEAW